MHGSTEYQCWLLLKNRCYNPNSKDYAYAGARGVRVCEAWRSSFQSFYDDMGARPPGHFLQRIRTTEEFGPGNCRWGRRRPGGRPKKVIGTEALLRRSGRHFGTFPAHIDAPPFSPARA